MKTIKLTIINDKNLFMEEYKYYSKLAEKENLKLIDLKINDDKKEYYFYFSE